MFASNNSCEKKRYISTYIGLGLFAAAIVFLGFVSLNIYNMNTSYNQSYLYKGIFAFGMALFLVVHFLYELSLQSQLLYFERTVLKEIEETLSR